MNDLRFFQAFFLLLFANALTAQFSGGVKLDLVSTNVKASSGSLDLDNVVQSKLAYKIGVFGAYYLTQNFSVETGINYNNLGFQVAQNTDVNLFGLSIPLGATLDTKVNYLEIPLLANYKIDLGSIQAYVEAGPSINYAMSGRVKTIANSFLDFNVLERELDFSSDRYNRTNITGNISIGVSQAMSQDIVLSAGIKYSRDLTSSLEIPIVNSRIQNQNIGLGLKLAKRF